MSRVFMKIAVYRNFLFDARCGAEDFFDKIKRTHKASFFHKRESLFQSAAAR